MSQDKNITEQTFHINRAQREMRNHHRGLVVWFSGLSGSGKSTIASAVEKLLFEHKIQTYILDGDNIRMGLNSDLGFSEQDRTENLRRIAETAKLFVDAGTVVLASFITPVEKNREQINRIISTTDIVHIFVNCPLEICEKRDVKGLYQKARAGQISNFTGINAPFEIPQNPDLVIHSDRETIEDSVQQVYQLIQRKISLTKE